MTSNTIPEELWVKVMARDRTDRVFTDLVFRIRKLPTKGCRTVCHILKDTATTIFHVNSSQSS